MPAQSRSTQDATTRTRPGRLLGDAIVELGFCDRETVEEAVRVARGSGRQMGQVLLEQGMLDADQLGRAVAARFELEFVELGSFDVDPAVRDLLAPDAMRRLDAAPIGTRAAGARRGAAPGCDTDAPFAQPIQDDPSALLVRSIVADAIGAGASHVHLDPVDGELLVRCRIDGVMRDITRVGSDEAASVISRIKILSELDVSERRAPQDGRLSLPSTATGSTSAS